MLGKQACLVINSRKFFASFVTVCFSYKSKCFNIMQMWHFWNQWLLNILGTHSHHFATPPFGPYPTFLKQCTTFLLYTTNVHHRHLFCENHNRKDSHSCSSSLFSLSLTCHGILFWFSVVYLMMSHWSVVCTYRNIYIERERELFHCLCSFSSQRKISLWIIEINLIKILTSAKPWKYHICFSL